MGKRPGEVYAKHGDLGPGAAGSGDPRRARVERPEGLRRYACCLRKPSGRFSTWFL